MKSPDKILVLPEASDLLKISGNLWTVFLEKTNTPDLADNFRVLGSIPKAYLWTTDEEALP